LWKDRKVGPVQEGKRGGGGGGAIIFLARERKKEVQNGIVLKPDRTCRGDGAQEGGESFPTSQSEGKERKGALGSQ